jgi:hypothetical protein
MCVCVTLSLSLSLSHTHSLSLSVCVCVWNGMYVRGGCLLVRVALDVRHFFDMGRVCLCCHPLTHDPLFGNAY